MVEITEILHEYQFKFEFSDNTCMTYVVFSTSTDNFLLMEIIYDVIITSTFIDILYLYKY